MAGTVPSLCCDRRGCIHNDCFCCTAEHIRLSGDGICVTYADAAEQRKIEIRCRPFQMEKPVMFISRFYNEKTALELAQLGFQKEEEPMTGLTGFLKKRAVNDAVWVLKGDFEQLNQLSKLLLEHGFSTVNLISNEEQETWRKRKQYSSMTDEEKYKLCYGHKMPILPAFVGQGYWNQKIYGYPGREMIYVDGKPVCITDAQAQELREYLKAKDRYDQIRGDLTRFG